jgi:hypothetical protein
MLACGTSYHSALLATHIFKKLNIFNSIQVIDGAEFTLYDVVKIGRTCVIFISQSYFKIPKIIRNNCSYMVLLKLSGNREVNLILSEFGLGVTKEELIEATSRLTKRMGGQHVKAAIEYLNEGDKVAWCNLLLNYYDKSYQHAKDTKGQIFRDKLKFDWNNKAESIKKLLEFSK